MQNFSKKFCKRYPNKHEILQMLLNCQFSCWWQTINKRMAKHINFYATVLI